MSEQASQPESQPEQKPEQTNSESTANPIPEGMDKTKADANRTTEPKSDKPAEEKKKDGIIDLVMGIPKAIWNKGVLPFYEFTKGIVTRIWGWCTSNYKAEVQLYKDLGPSKYLLDRGSKVLIKVLKVVAIVTVAGLINTLLVNMTGISLFDPMTLAFVAIAALILLGAKSYKTQKETSDKFSFAAMGNHMVEGIAAA
jgi:hypothetical protein